MWRTERRTRRAEPAAGATTSEGEGRRAGLAAHVSRAADARGEMLRARSVGAMGAVLAGL